MNVEFLTQPNRRLGDLIDKSIVDFGLPQQLVVVSAFASLPTIFRLKPTVSSIRLARGDVRLVLGIDLGGTSKEVLREVSGWAVPVNIVKNKASGTTFHPKLYLLRWHDRAEIILGSNNLTDGGLYRNYEASVRTAYTLPADREDYEKAIVELNPFLNPTGPTVFLLTPESLETLLACRGIPSETDARKARGEATGRKPNDDQFGTLFSYERIPPAPTLPPELQALLLAAREGINSAFRKAVSNAKRRAARLAPGTPAEALPMKPSLPAQLDPSAFYMTLPAMQGDENPNIPGEPRIPIEAIEMAEDFWGWPENYVLSISPRKGAGVGVPRIYREWKPPWRILASDDPENAETTEVRMYFYQNSGDFRFYAGALVRLAAGAGDIVRLRRIDEADAIFECVLARVGTPEHAAWLPLLVNNVQTRNSVRRFGFA